MAERELQEFEIIPATWKYVNQVVAAEQAFFDETSQAGRIRVNPQKWRDNLINLWAGDHFKTFIALDALENIVGFAHCHLDTSYTYDDEPVGEVVRFCVLAPWRKSLAGRQLRDAAVAWFDASNCPISYAESASGLDSGKNDKLFSNLWRKIGFQVVGTTLIRYRG